MTRLADPNLTAFPYDKVVAQFDGLLFNIEGGLENLFNRVASRFGTPAPTRPVLLRQLELMMLILRQAKITNSAMCYLTGDVPEDHRRKPEYALVLPSVNRHLIDVLSTLVYMRDDFPFRFVMFERSGYADMRRYLVAMETAHASDPAWQPHLQSLGVAINAYETACNVDTTVIQNPNGVPFWPTPWQIAKNKDGKYTTQSRPFLQVLTELLWKDTSQQAHFTMYGFLQIAPILYGERMPEQVEEVQTRYIPQYHYQHFLRNSILVLAIASEIDDQFKLGNKEQLARVWASFIQWSTTRPDVEPEVKELYDARYKAMLEPTP